MMQDALDMVKRGRAFGFGLLCRGAFQSAMPSRRAKRQRSALVLMVPALLWVFTQLVMSGFIMQPTQALASGLHTITICSGSELTTITVDAEGKPVSDIPAKKVHCPWCAQFGGIGELPPPNLAPVSLPCGEAQKLALPQGQTIAATAPFFNYITRAPPLSTSL